MRQCPHTVVSGQCPWCLAEALEKERQILARMRQASRCTCTTVPTETPGLRQFEWDPDCPHHRVED